MVSFFLYKILICHQLNYDYLFYYLINEHESCNPYKTHKPSSLLVDFVMDPIISFYDLTAHIYMNYLEFI